MIYRLPTIDDQLILNEYVKEHIQNGEPHTASQGLTKMEYYEWVKIINDNAVKGNKMFGKSYLYLCFDNDELIGLLSIRYEMPEDLRLKYGDIGYGVRPSKRRHGYAKEMLSYALTICKEKKMEEVILGCIKDNTASRKTILSNGGILFDENNYYDNIHLTEYYKIKL